MLAGIRRWLNNHSLRFKLTGQFLVLVIILQLTTGVLVSSAVERKLRADILASNQNALAQMAANVDEVLVNIVDGLYPVLVKARGTPLHLADEARDREYINSNIEYQALYNQLISSRNNYRYINAMIIQSEDSVHAFVSNGHTGLVGDNLYEKLLADFSDEAQHYIWRSDIPDTYFFGQHNEEIISLVVPIRLYKKVRSFVILNISAPRLGRYVQAMGSGDTRVFLQAPDGMLLSVEDEAIQPQLADFDREAVVIEGNDVLLTHRLSVNGWNLSMHYVDQGTAGVDFLLQAVVPMFIGISVLVMVLSGFIVSEVTKPLRKLTSIMRENSRTSQKPLRFKAQYKDEVGLLGSTYNQMMDDLAREQRQSRMAYMRMLQMQIKPHFLYNSMESTRFLIEMNDPKAVEMISAISTYYKLSLSGVNETVPLREEMEHLSCYLQILQIRYASRYAYTLDIPEEMLGDEIEKFTMQPLVENAVYHGIKPKRGQGFIRMRGWREDSDNVIEILDSGVGIAPEKLREIQQALAVDEGMEQTEHIGVLNVHQRLRMRYGPGYGLTLESVQGEYTRVKVRIPSREFVPPKTKEAKDEW